LTINLRTYYALRRAAVRQQSQRLRRDAERVLAHFNRGYTRFFWEEKAGFDPDQPRDDHGRWTDTVGGGGAARRSPRDVVAQGDFGVLIAEIPVAGGRRCVYKFPAISIVVPGPTNFACTATAHWSAVTHGRLLNDNRPR
jgi:hypothetical protein